MDVCDVSVEFSHAAVPVAHVFAEAHVGHHDELRQFALEPPHGALHHAIFRVGLRRLFIAHHRDAEEDHRAHAGLECTARLVEQRVFVELRHARHRGHGLATLHFFRDEKREHKIIRRQRSLADEGAELRSGAEAAGTAGQVHARLLEWQGVKGNRYAVASHQSRCEKSRGWC